MKILLFPLLFIVFSCTRLDKMSKKVQNETIKENKKVILVAESNTSEPNRIFVVRTENHFEFLEGASCKNCKAKYYAGTYRESRDTIFLNFHRSHKPDNIVSYFMIDSSRRHIVISHTNGENPLLLEIKSQREKF
jgi:hypothetical protein